MKELYEILPYGRGYRVLSLYPDHYLTHPPTTIHLNDGRKAYFMKRVGGWLVRWRDRDAVADFVEQEHMIFRTLNGYEDEL